MAAENTKDEGFYGDLKEPIGQQRDVLNRINVHLRKANVGEIKPGNDAHGITAILEAGQLSLDVTKLIDSHIQYSVSLSEAADLYIKAFEHDWKVKQKKSADVRKAERDAMWVLWFQRTVRWSAGALFVVFLYSAVVWVSEHSSFIKVPVRDLVVPHEHG